MQRHEFSGSSQIRAIEYDGGDTVVVEFKKGDRCRYGSFTAQEIEDWKAAKSPGSWFYVNVRRNPAGHPRLDDDVTLVVAAETTLGDPPPADGWHALQSNFVPGGSFTETKAAAATAAEVVVFTASPSERVDFEPPRTFNPAPAGPKYKTALARARASRKPKA